MLSFKQFFITESGKQLKTGMFKNRDGDKQWYKNGKLHRLDGPACIWLWHGVGKEWYVDGKRHRLDGPAIEYADGSKVWYVDGKRHRLDGPAVESADGYKAWYVNDKRHRLDGPAVEQANGDKEWFIDGNELTEDEFNAYLKQKEVKAAISKNNQSGWEM